MPPPTICWAQAPAAHLVSAQCQLAPTSINSASTWLTLPSDKSHLIKCLFKKNGFLAVCGVDLGSELTPNSTSI